MAWEFLRPVLTANALATIQANPVLLAYFVAWLFVILFLMGVAVYISYVTGKPYRKPKKPAAAAGGKGGAGKGGAAGAAAPAAAAARRGETTTGSRFSLNMKLPSLSLPSVKLPSVKLPSVSGTLVKGFFRK